MELKSKEIAKKVNGDATLDRFYEKGLQVKSWCENQQPPVDRSTLYRIARGEHGFRRNAVEALRICRLLDAAGLLVLKKDQKTDDGHIDHHTQPAA